MKTKKSLVREDITYRTFVLLLLSVIIFGLTIRIIGLSRVPTGISSDILLYFSDARALAETGKDIYGRTPNLYFSHKGYLINPVTVYVTALVYKIFGFSLLNGFVPNIIMSVTTIAVTAFLAIHLTEKRRIGLTAAFIVAVSPWHYHLSRTGFEGVFGYALVLTGIYSSILAIKKPWMFTLSLVLFFLAAFSYKAINVFLFLYPIVFVLTLGRKKIRQSHGILFTLGIWTIIFFQWFLLFFYYHDTYATGVMNKNISQARQDSQTEMLLSDAPRLVRLVASNPVLSLGKIYFTNYTHFFSPQYLLTTGDSDLRFSTGYHGQLYALDVFLILGGVLWLRNSKRRRALAFLSAVILVAPFASLISDEEYAIRTMIAVYSIAVLGACGVEQIFSVLVSPKVRTISLSVLFALYACSFALYLYRYHYLYIHYGRAAWDFGSREIDVEAYMRSSKYTRITFGRASEIEYLGYMYWNKLPVQEIQLALSHYDDKKLANKNVNFVRTCNFLGDTFTTESFIDNELVYTLSSCFTETEPTHRYYLPKTLTWWWKSYDSNSFH